MKILLHPNRTVGEIQEEFSVIFPFLKIEFFFKRRNVEGAMIKEQVDPLFSLVETGVCDQGGIEINPNDTVKEVVQKIEGQYGLPVSIYRKQKGVWTDTSITDDLTLHEQDTWGREASKPLKIKIDNNSDWNSYSLRK